MLETKEVTFNVVDDSTSGSFIPKASFVVQAVGTIDANVQFIVQQLPYQLADTSTSWATAPMSPVAIEADSPVSTVNYAYGFKYRIMKGGTGTQSTAGLVFHIGHGTVERAAFASNN